MKKIHGYHHDKTYRAVENIPVIIDSYTRDGPDSCIKDQLTLAIAALKACNEVESVIKDLEEKEELHKKKDFSDFSVGSTIAYQDALKQLREVLAPFKELVD